MTTEDELRRRLAATAAAIDDRPDLDAVLARRGLQRSRVRRMMVLAAAAVGLVGVGSLVVVANREPRTTSDRPPPPATTPQPGEVPVTTTNPPSTSESTAESTSASTSASMVPDPADPYLERTTVVFDEVMNDDHRFVVRLSDVSYGELFDIDWNAPTGSLEECLGGPALITGDPNGGRGGPNDASSWDAHPLPPLSEARPTDITAAAGPFSFNISTASDTSVFLVRTQLPVSDLVVDGEGIASTTAEFVDGVAAVAVTADVVPEEPGSASMTVALDQATVTMQPEPGSIIDPSLLALPLFAQDELYEPPPACRPTPGVQVELPPPGEPPADPETAEATIRQRFALAVDPTIPFGDKPDDLFDSTAGIEQAIDDALTGTNGDYVRNASYEIVDLVFTSPGEAWFQYDLEAQGVMFRPFGRATFDGETWQIGRDTICQDLTRVGALCDPGSPTDAVTPPDDGASPPPTTLSEQQRRAYIDALFCNPIRPCDEP